MVVDVVAADARGGLYWLDSGNVMKLPAGLSNPTFANVVTVINTGDVTDLAVDAFGDLIYAIGDKVYVAPLGTANGTDYTVPAAAGQLATVTDLAPHSLSVDAVGNIYGQSGYAANNLKMIAAGNGSTVFDVLGTGAVTVSKPSVGADGTLFYLDISGGGVNGHTMKL